jgi:hypothetical protein
MNRAEALDLLRAGDAPCNTWSSRTHALHSDFSDMATNADKPNFFLQRTHFICHPNMLTL